MRELDKFETAATGDFPVSILGNVSTGDFELVALDVRLSASDIEAKTKAAERGLTFVGNVGIRNGRPMTALACEPPEAMLGAMAQAYLRHVADRLFESTMNAFWQRIAPFGHTGASA